MTDVPWGFPVVSFLSFLIFWWLTWKPSSWQKFMAVRRNPSMNRIQKTGRIVSLTDTPLIVFAYSFWSGGTDTSSPYCSLGNRFAWSDSTAEFECIGERYRLDLQFASFNAQVVQPIELDEIALEKEGWKSMEHPSKNILINLGIQNQTGYKFWQMEIASTNTFNITGWLDSNRLYGKNPDKPLLLLNSAVPENSIVQLTAKGRSKEPNVFSLIMLCLSAMFFLVTFSLYLAGFLIR